MPGKRRVAFPVFGNYNLCIKYFVEKGLDVEYIDLPPLTRRSLENGERYSPDSVCTPFKTTLGSNIDALEAGADMIIMPMGICRLAYYGELQQEILKELGYDAMFVNFSEYSTGNAKDYLKALKLINPNYKKVRMGRALADALVMLENIDKLEAVYYENCGFEINRGDYKKAWEKFKLSMSLADSLVDIEKGYRETRRDFASIPLEKPVRPVRVGVIGEYYTVMDEFSNLNIEQKLADMGVEVHRWMNISHRNLHYKEKNLSAQIAEYCKNDMGPTSTANIWCAKYYAAHGFDGIVHVKSAGCTPEIDIMPVLRNIGEDYKIPILYLTYDSQTSDTGLDTRLEAFYDMLSMRNKNDISENVGVKYF